MPSLNKNFQINYKSNFFLVRFFNFQDLCFIKASFVHRIRGGYFQPRKIEIYVNLSKDGQADPK